MIEVLLITGPAGVGKSSVAFELSLQLQSANVAHALIDTDELDRVFPSPSDLRQVTEQNLAAVWETFRQRGVTRLILAGVFLDQPEERDWIMRAIPDSKFTAVRLTGVSRTVLDRVRRREIGSGLQAQLERTRRQLGSSDPQPGDHIVATENRTVAAITEEVRVIWDRSR